MITPSELIMNDDGSIFHLHVRPGEVAPTIILVGDPARCGMVASYFDSIELERSNREMRTITGSLRGQPISVVSTGIGCDNIDIVLTELDALFNVDFESRTPRAIHTQLTLVRLGTSGAVARGIEVGQYVASESSVGLDGLAYFHANSERVRNLEREESFIAHTRFVDGLARPYVVDADGDLLALFGDMAIGGLTVSASGFYAPQGRVVRLPLAMESYIERMEEAGVANFEMEGAAISLLGRMLGHKTLTVCAIIAQRTKGEAQPDYGQIVEKLVRSALDRLIK